MGNHDRQYLDDVPDDVGRRLRVACAGLPEAYEERAWKGTRWRVRKRTFAHVLGVRQGDGPVEVALTFRSSGEELEVLRNIGPPFFELGWGRGAVGLVLDGSTDWGEVAELVTESYCVMAPKRLAALVDRPGDP